MKDSEPLVYLAGVLFSVLHWATKNAIDAQKSAVEQEKQAREKAEARVATLEAKVQIYREEQIATTQQIRSLDEKVDRVITMLERMSGGGSRP